MAAFCLFLMGARKCQEWIFWWGKEFLLELLKKQELQIHQIQCFRFCPLISIQSVVLCFVARLCFVWQPMDGQVGEWISTNRRDLRQSSSLTSLSSSHHQPSSSLSSSPPSASASSSSSPIINHHPRPIVLIHSLFKSAIKKDTKTCGKPNPWTSA